MKPHAYFFPCTKRIVMWTWTANAGIIVKCHPLKSEKEPDEWTNGRHK